MHLTTLKQEILRSDILRVTILMWIFLFLIIAIYIAMQLQTRINQTTFHNTKEQLFPFIALGCVSFYFYIQRLIRIRYYKMKKSLPTFFVYCTLLIETNIPIILLLMFFHFAPPITVPFGGRPNEMFLFVILSALTLNYRMCIFSGVVAALGYGILSFAIQHQGIYTPGLSELLPSLTSVTMLMLLLAGCVTAFVTQQITNNLFSAFKAEDERAQIASVFGRHVSPEVVNMLLEHKKSSLTESRFVSILFLDIRNFTTYSENKNPEDVVKFLNQLFSISIEAINKHHGIINKFLGDGFMAVFGAPIKGEHDIEDAVSAGEEILQKINAKIAERSLPNLRIGIGIHCGVAVTGTVGDTQRQEYTIIGDVVNLASRIEQLNKEYTSQILISGDVYKLLKEPRGDLIGDIQVKGRKQPITVYRLQ